MAPVDDRGFTEAKTVFIDLSLLCGSGLSRVEVVELATALLSSRGVPSLRPVLKWTVEVPYMGWGLKSLLERVVDAGC